ncbi:cucumisin-like [Impatiens glandulifera]|uniref:cucumisin-like n=1 Tax=Impatiens glandulifera TaxID=253017 RepID=UPI001FB19426|nr:cucumisin-like [Impatiens glandulifera]
MLTKRNSIVPIVLGLSIFFAILLPYTHGQDRQEYIVYLGELKLTLGIPTSLLHLNFLQKALGSTSSASIIYSYKNSFNGFVARLTSDEVQLISSMQGVVSVFPNKINQLHTTRSWDFMGFSETVQRATTVESDTIVGVIDTGIWPESDSFNDIGFGFPPTKWKGSCGVFTNFTCNNKIIGAKYYKMDGVFGENDIQSPRDSQGHGTHTASTVAGDLVTSASFSGLANGTARGGVPSSRIAVYKVCWSDGCSDADILAAFDDAITDGVDIISISIGFSVARPYLSDSIAIGSFHAMKRGILTSMSAGNSGPSSGTISNVAPWALSVAASTIDRNFLTGLQLGNAANFQGVTVNTFVPNGFSPIVYAGNVPNKTGNVPGTVSRLCQKDSLDPTLVKGKIIVCDQFNLGEAALLAGAAGMVIQGDGPKDYAFVFALPTTYVSSVEGSLILTYISTESNPTASIMKSNEAIDEFAPYTATFSSRGPNPLSFNILKPDLSAPGVDILAAWTLGNSPTEIQADTRRLPFNIISGTSMACPHATGAAAYVKTFNPLWSAAAIKSALMTTAFEMSPDTTPLAEFGYGSGQINPVAALNPGLVYDANQADYVQFLCGQGYTDRQLQIVTDDTSTCSSSGSDTSLNLNLPSFSASVLSSIPFNVTFNRRVTNVGLASSTYSVAVLAPAILNIQVVPSTLSFSSVGQTQSFTVTVEGTLSIDTFVSASLSWVDATHKVRSPIVIFSTT